MKNHNLLINNKIHLHYIAYSINSDLKSRKELKNNIKTLQQTL